MYSPRPLSEAPGSVAATLAAHAWHGTLTIYAGAGVSAAPPASLPGAAALATRVVAVLRDQINLEGVDADDLVAVADRVSAEALGDDLLRQTILDVAELLSAEPNHAHEVLGLLICEGAATVFETNYDNCIERGAQPEMPSVVRTAVELLHSSGPALLKVHGCATLPKTMLITTAELESAPGWAQTRVSAQFANDRVIFIGLGSPADYVCKCIEGLLREVGVDHVVLVDPSLNNWDEDDTLSWRQLLPELGPDNRDSRTADEFCDALLRAYVVRPIKEAKQMVEGLPATHPKRVGLDLICGELESRSAAFALRWFRSSASRMRVGDSPVRSTTAIRGLLALGALVADSRSVELSNSNWWHVNARRLPSGIQDGANDDAPVVVPVLLLMAHTPTTGAAAAAEAHQRVLRARENDLIAPGELAVVVITNQIGQLVGELPIDSGESLGDVLAKIDTTSTRATPEQIVAIPAANNVLDGARRGTVVLVNGDALIEAA